MRKLKLQMHMSLDGFVAGPGGQLDWIGTIAADKALGDFFSSLIDTSDTMILGRKTTHEIVSYWEDVAFNQPGSPEHPVAEKMVAMRKIAFTKSDPGITGKNVEVESGDLVTAVTALKKQPGKDIIVYGGVRFVSDLVKQDLIDEYHLLVNPIAIGDGLSIFKEKKLLKLKESVPYKNGVIANTYIKPT